MANEQTNSNEYIAQAVTEAAKVAVQAMAMTSRENNQRTHNVGPKVGSPLMRQLTFSLDFHSRYAELRNFRMEVMNMLQN